MWQNILSLDIGKGNAESGVLVTDINSLNNYYSTVASVQDPVAVAPTIDS